uniref:RRM domain-containing protein n=1 Tax=Periophthalmus magnuspinnatus TaxID=409849 RepID=A0A3B4A401_9GOBI
PDVQRVQSPCPRPEALKGQIRMVLPLKFCSSSVAHHKLYVKEHKVRDEKSSYRPVDRTLFVLNVPPYCSEDVIKRIFSQFGNVNSVELRDQPGSSPHHGPKLSNVFKPAEKHGFKVGYIVFENSSSIKAAKSHPSTCNSHLNCEEEQRRKKEEQQQEDEDGWVKVTRGHKGAKARPHSEMANQRTLAKEMKKKKRKELMNFYTWQHRNTQKEHIAELRKKFEEDKQRIALLRAQRKFKPY